MPRLLRRTLLLCAFAFSCRAQDQPVERPGVKDVQVPAASLQPIATIHLGGSPDWLAISDDSVWVANAQFKAVQRIDPQTNTVSAMIELPAEPCSGLAFAFGSLWVPLCKPASLVRVDPATGKISATFPFGPIDSEGGITASDDSVWLVTDENGTLLRIDPATNAARQKISIEPGSFNPLYSDGFVWITGTKSSVLTPVNARTGEALPPISVGLHPRFLAAGSGSIWTLNQGDGSITRVDAKSRRVLATIQAGIPGPGGDICYSASTQAISSAQPAPSMPARASTHAGPPAQGGSPAQTGSSPEASSGSIWATVFDVPLTLISPDSNKVLRQWNGPGGDAVRVGHNSLWLTDLRNGLLLRLSPSTLTK